MLTKTDYECYMRQAIEVAQQNPSAPFGALLIHSETKQTWATGINRGQENPIWHGEIDAINECVRTHEAEDIPWGELALFSTAEPCPMCQSAAIWSGIGQVIYGTSIEFLLSQGWNQIAIRAAEVGKAGFTNCEISGGILEQECNQLFLKAKS